MDKLKFRYAKGMLRHHAKMANAFTLHGQTENAMQARKHRDNMQGIVNEFEKMKGLIMTYDGDDIHNACVNLGHSTAWANFESELENYLREDMQNLLDELASIV